jgi:hypothetical protein
LQDIDQVGSAFAEPSVSSYYADEGKAGPGILWLIQLIPPEADK